MSVFSKMSVVLCGVVFLIGLFLGYTFSRSEEKCHHSFSSINPFLVCDGKPAINKKEYDKFSMSLRMYIMAEEKKGTLEDAAVFFRDLHGGPTFGINERRNFIPASLLKLPQAVAILDLEESQGSVLEKTFTIAEAPSNLTQHYQVNDRVKAGNEYSIENYWSIHS